MLRTDHRPNRNLLIHVTAATLLGSVACASGDLADSSALDERADAEPAALITQARDPGDSYFADVKANGTGCPAGKWQTDISADGKTFTTSFTEYEVEVTKTKRTSIKDCNLRIALNSPQGLSFAVQSFQYSGYALLDKGVNLKHVATYYFQGRADDGDEAETELVGPYDDTFVFKSDVASTDQVWSECGKQRNLNVRSTLRLLNADPAVEGYANIAAIDARTKLVFKLAWKPCKPAAEKPAAKADEKKEETKKEETKKEETKKEVEKPASKPSGGRSVWGGGPTVIGVTRQ